MAAYDLLADYDGDVLVINGDMPLVRESSLLALLELHRREGNDCTVLTYYESGELPPFGRVLRGARLYVALFPCNECAKAIIQCGISEIVYLSDKYNGTDMNLASKRMLDAAGVRYHQLPTQLHSITLDFSAEA